MRIYREEPEFRPITLLIESEEELAALWIALANTKFSHLEKARNNEYYPEDMQKMFGMMCEKSSIFHEAYAGIISELRTIHGKVV